MSPHSVIPVLEFHRLPGSRKSVHWDLGVYTYQGAAQIGRAKAPAMIRMGELGEPKLERLPVLVKLHEVIEAELERGVSPNTVRAKLKNLGTFVSWVDMRQKDLCMQTLRECYLEWCGHMTHRYRVVKDISHEGAYATVAGPAKIIGRALGYINEEPGRALLKCSTMVAPKRHKKVLSTKGDKARQEDLFAFGSALLDICNGLSHDEILRGAHMNLNFRNGSSVYLKGKGKCWISPHGKDEEIEVKQSFVNLRIEAELLIFIAQTGMNLAQVESLRQCQYRWRSDGDELDAIRVYKGRRGGEVVFRCFREYRNHLRRYLDWLTAVGLREEEELMFPFIREFEVLRQCSFSATKSLCARAGVSHVMPGNLRKARINWLLRRSRDPGLTAEQAAHTKETLLQVYEEPHHQSASIEIIRFHKKTDPTIRPPGSGICVGAERGPEAIEGIPENAPEPDCISPEGCLFCIHHRDVMSSDYCWKLASHAELKKLELTKFRPPKGEKKHPAQTVISRIQSKLEAISQGSEVRAQWVRDAKDSVRSGVVHPRWEGHVQLIEVL